MVTSGPYRDKQQTCNLEQSLTLSSSLHSAEALRSFARKYISIVKVGNKQSIYYIKCS